MATATKAAIKTRATTRPKDDPAAKVKKASIRFKAASDPTRLRVLLALRGGATRHVGGLLADLGRESPGLSQPALSFHLGLLRFGGLVEPERRGKEVHYRLTAGGEELAGLADSLLARKGDRP